MKGLPFDFFTVALIGITVAVVASFAGIVYGAVMWIFFGHQPFDFILMMFCGLTFAISILCARKFVEREN